MEEVELRGRAAYLAYRDAVGGVAVNGDPIPGWEGLLPRIREAWRAAADAAVMVTDLRAEGK